MQSYICTTCGVAHEPSETPPAVCAICADERQYVNAAGQGWTTLAQLQERHRNEVRELEPGLVGIGTVPQVAIGQRALVAQTDGGGVMWDCTPLVTGEAVAALKARGGVRAMAISHPHFYSSMGDWSTALGDVPIYLHEADRGSVMRQSANIVFWAGEVLELGGGVTLIRCGGHFAGSTALHWADGAEGKGALFSSDTIMVTPDLRWLSFMYSYPNLIPVSARTVERIVSAVTPYAFDRIYGGWWDRVCERDAKARLQASAARYVAAVTDR